MGNYFHLLLEAPQANLVAGMKWLFEIYSQGWNRVRGRKGHVFQGRYKSVPVSGSDADRYYFRSVVDCIHLNPVRAGLVGERHGKLADEGATAMGDFVEMVIDGGVRRGVAGDVGAEGFGEVRDVGGLVLAAEEDLVFGDLTAAGRGGDFLDVRIV